MKWIILVLGILTNASASVLIKMALGPSSKPISLAKPMLIATNWQLLLGVLLYGIAFILYVIALAKFPLNIAHPVLTAGALASVALCSFFIFKETFYWSTLLGLMLIIFGVLLITFRAA
ncbi:DMT family transporter [Thorsellia anophelis]|uniref:Multidrug transporter EmrE n=1 Tax=Thorsellia anophelis DSM 18579 TaxID=1123402 RepID=A0A1I0FEP0_9GAMM|nr:EamA family transporter [Thorsellia anophelis]SET56736.1 Multidrug transporter EmrE [Thorsellia anophelis DSM 18579]